MKKKSWLLLSTLAVSVTLAACGGNQTETKVETKNPEVIEHEGTVIPGGTLKYAIVASSPNKGVLIDELSQDTGDSAVIGFIDESMFEWDENRKLVNTGLASLDIDVDAKTITVKLNKEDYKWSDGQPVTIDDYIFATHAIGNKDYPGVRYDDDYRNIVGMEEYHAGTAESISGMKKVDDYTVVISYKEMTPSMQLAGGALSAYIMPKHIFESIPITEWESSEYVRGTKHVGLGAFKVKAITPGEAVTVERNEYYYKGAAKLDGAVIEVVSPQNIVSEMKAGNYDIASMPASQYTTYADADNFSLAGALASSYEYVAFHLGKFDKASGKNIYDPNSKMADKSLRQAMGYALDIDQVGEALYNGLMRNANSLIIPFFKDVTDTELAGYSYKPDEAKKILDEAGYKDLDGDGLRENPKGEKLSINFAARTRDDANEALVQQYLEWWKAIGLDVKLYTGRTLEFNSFYDKLEADDPEIDVYAGGWSTGYDPNPSGLYGEEAQFNMTRFVSDENTRLLNQIASLEAFDEKKNKEFYKEWQQYAFDEAFAIPTITGDSVTAVNKRVKYYDTILGSEKSSLHNLELTADKGQAATN